MEKKKEKKEEKEELVKDNTKMHSLSAPTVGKNHDWVQQGPHIVCRSCESPHGFRIGTNKRLKGFDKEGNMIIENV